MKIPSKKSIILTLQSVFSIVIFMLMYHKIASEKTIDLKTLITLPMIFVVFSTGIMQVSLNSIIQGKLLKIYSLTFSHLTLLKNNFISVMYLLIIPGFFAPDFYLGYVFGKEKNNFSRVISALFINRVIGLSLFVLLAFIALFGIWDKIQGLIKVENTTYYSFVFVFVIISFFAFLYVLKKYATKWFSKIKVLYDETKAGRNKIIQAIILKLGFNLLGLAGRIFIGKILGIPISFIEFASIILILNLLISLPVSINGIGVREAGYVGLMVMFGVPADKALLFAFCEFSIIMSSSLIGLVIWVYSFLSKRFSHGTNLGD